MPEETHTEVTREGWTSRLGGAFKGILFGLIVLGLGVWLLFWNEGRSVLRAKALDEGAGVVVSVSADTVEPSNEGKLVHLTGRAETDDVLRDPTFGVSDNAIHLKREVEIYQWHEVSDRTTEKKLGGSTETTTTYSYEKRWSSSLVDSDQFKRPEGHENPESMPYEGYETSAQEVRIGAFELSPSLVDSMSRYEPLPVESLDGLPAELRYRSRLHDGGIYIGRGPSSPEIGDLRIEYQVSRPEVVSVVARQTGDSLGPYRVSNGGTVQLLSYGAAPAEAMFDSAQKSNRTMTWVLRVVGFLLLTVGFKRLFRPLSVMADVVPAMGRLVEAGTGFVAYLLAFVLWLLVVAIAWIYHRPVLGMTLLLVAGGVLVAALLAILRSTRRQKREAAAA